MTSDPARPPIRPVAKNSETMADVRREIDRLDRELVLLMAERLRYIEEAAKVKQDRDRVRDEDRIEDVVAKVLAESAKVGLAPEVAEPVWRLLIERSIAHEYVRFDAEKSAAE
ncbi:MAG: chorismate mutase [Candidatus Phaeomarinobacter sp.]